MRLVDLTSPVPVRENFHPNVTADPWSIKEPGFSYTGMVYHFHHWSMAGTYIDLPSHIKELDDGTTAENYPLDNLYEIPAVVIHLDRSEKPGKIYADELEAACPCPTKCGALIINALGSKGFDEIRYRSVALSRDAATWIVDKGVHILVADVYEHETKPENIFWTFFKAGVSTVCSPINLDQLDKPAVKLTVMFPRFPGVTQLPCRAVARIDY